MQLLRADHHLLLRLVRGEELHECVQALAAMENIEHAVVMGLGAIEQVELGAWDVPDKHYTRRQFDGAYELASLNGNISWVDGAPYMHAHVCIAGHDFVALAGHLFTSRVYATVELSIHPGRGHVERKMDDAIGLKLLELPEHCKFPNGTP